MKLNPQEIGKILTDHLDRLSTEEFITNVKEFCPYLFEDARDPNRLEEQSFKVPENPIFPVITNDRASQESANLRK